MKLKHLKISNKQLTLFAARIGRRLLRNSHFTAKLAGTLNDASVSDTSERREQAWGLEGDDGKADKRGFRGGPVADDSSETEWESRDAALDALARRGQQVKEAVKKGKKRLEKEAKERMAARRKAKKAPLSIGAVAKNVAAAAKEDAAHRKEVAKLETAEQAAALKEAAAKGDGAKAEEAAKKLKKLEEEHGSP